MMNRVHRILVTRAAHQAGRLSEGLRAAGFEPVEVPVIEIQPPASFDPLDAALRSLPQYDWLILTSANTVRILVERAALCDVALAQAHQVAAIGQATAEAARHAGLTVSLTPHDYVAESLMESLGGHVSHQRILLARAAIARDIIPDALRAAGAVVDIVDAYQNVIPTAASDQLKAAVADRIDAVTFTSSSSAHQLADVARAAGMPFPFVNVPAISIGPITSATLRELNWPPAAEADPHDIPGLIAAVQRVLGS